jgi:eukaryotic-like serine/threonine-protein kinase
MQPSNKPPSPAHPGPHGAQDPASFGQSGTRPVTSRHTEIISTGTPAAGTPSGLGPPPAPPRPNSFPQMYLQGGAPPIHPLPEQQLVDALSSTVSQEAPEPDVRAAMKSVSPFARGADPEASLEILPPAQVDLPPPGERKKDPYIGTTFDHRYKIEQLLGEGGMGVVYLARHKIIDKKVAVKVLRADMAKDREILDRFMQEAKSASSIGNPHIVDISDFGDLPDGSTYFVMELLDGTSLGQLIERNTRFPLERICQIGMQMADGLAAAHAGGIVHRDLKPDNVFLVSRGAEKDFVKILDFGIAKVSKAGNTKLTRAGAVFGTPHYMSPEQAAGAPVDHRTDIYSLGIMLYELVSGQLPFNADNFMGILTQHMYKSPVPIRALVPAPDCPPGMEAVILKCLSKKPDGRYASMEALAADLERVKRNDVPLAVGEMMARSGGFNVPHDFFKPAPKMIVPATPSGPRTPWPRYVWLAGALAAVGLVTLIVIKGSTGSANPLPPGASNEVAPPPPPTVVVTPATAAPLPSKKTVALAAYPSEAVAYRDGQALRMPALIEVEEGKTVTVEVKADGFEPLEVVLDGKEDSKSVKLVALPKKAGPTRPSGGGRPNPGPTKKSGGSSSPGGVVNPWD